MSKNVFTMIVDFFAWLLGRATVLFFHAYNTLTIPKRDGGFTTLDALVKDVTPPCWLNPFLFNGHLHTIWCLRRSGNRRVSYKRKVFEADDPSFAGIFAVDFVVQEHVETAKDLAPGIAYYTKDELANLGSDDDRPMLILQHGLSGGSHEIYLRQVIDALCYNTGDLERWEACVINFRGCAGSQISTDILYNARATWDIRQLVKWIRLKYPNRPLYAIGFSIGANVLTNYVGEEGDGCMLRAVMSISNPYNLEIVAHGLRSTWLGREVYLKTLGAAMRQLMKIHEKVLSKSSRFDYGAVMKTKYLHEFDRGVQCPTWGYPTEGAYYRDASSIDALLAVRIPYFAIHAMDDPITIQDALPYGEINQNPFVVLCTTSSGGHLSWFQFGGNRWYVKPVAGFFRKMQEIREEDLAPYRRKLTETLSVTHPTVGAYLETRPRLPVFHEPL